MASNGGSRRVRLIFSMLKVISRRSWHYQAGPIIIPGSPAFIPHCTRAKALIYGWITSVVGRLGALHPALIEKCGVSGPVYLFELNLNMIKFHQLNEFKNISKFPGVRRDIALTVIADDAGA